MKDFYLTKIAFCAMNVRLVEYALNLYATGKGPAQPTNQSYVHDTKGTISFQNYFFFKKKNEEYMYHKKLCQT